MSDKERLSKARRHAVLRWIGAPLLCSGVVLLGLALLSIFRGGATVDVMLSLFGCGLALASFGANHDTALALAVEARQSGETLPESLAAEVDEEESRDRHGALSLRPAPRIGMVLPLIAIGVQSAVLWRLIGG